MKNENESKEQPSSSFDRKRSRNSSPDEEEEQKRSTIDSNNNNNNNNNNMDIDIHETTPTSSANCTNINTNKNMQEEEEPPSNRQRTIHPNQITSMKLEAIFHPKFENENLNNQQIRQTMIQKLSPQSASMSSSCNGGGGASGASSANGVRTDHGKGILEVSLKHSGSLVLWSGGNRFYSKNATDNVHTHTAELLLRQHFARCWSKHSSSSCSTSSTSSTSSNEVYDDIIHEKKYQECSDYIQKHRLTLSFEIITSVLGHHGDIPNTDFLILISISNRSTQSFYTTSQLISFCHTFKLPHNDIWMIETKSCALKLFHLYDEMREYGLAKDVVEKLNDICNDGSSDGGGHHLCSLYPHDIYQGDILEGIVIRFVRMSDDNQNDQNSSLLSLSKMLEQLCQQSEAILNEVPPGSKIDWTKLLSSSSSSSSSNSAGSIQLLKTNLRELFHKHNEDASSFAKSLEKIIKQAPPLSISSSSPSSSSSLGAPTATTTTRTIFKLGKKEVDIPLIASRLLSQIDNNDNDKTSSTMMIDQETCQICQLIQTMERLKLSVTYHVMVETNHTYIQNNIGNDNHNNMDISKDENRRCSSSTSSSSKRYLCIIHILHDACHQKYHVATRTSGGMSLFRGFSIELVTSNDTVSSTTLRTAAANSSLDLNDKLQKVRLQSLQSIDNNNDERSPSSFSSSSTTTTNEKKLMLKMKFLPYMIRTFICRNGLSILQKRGITGFNQYAYDLLRKWEISKESIDKWLGFIHAWGRYCESSSSLQTTTTEDEDGKKKVLPKLNSSNYLHHYYHFERLYKKGFFKAMFNQETSFYGLVVVVGPINKERTIEFSLRLSTALGCTKTVCNINDFSEADMAASMQSEGGGVVCAATITEGVKRLRMLEKRYKENIYVVMIGCTKEEIEAEFVQSGNPNNKELKKIVGMSNGWKKVKAALCIQVPHICLSEEVSFDTDDHLKKMVDHLKRASKSSQPDNRPGILVYFPNIPGCGKSFLCSDVTKDSLNIQTDRKLIVREGDKTTGKFWPLALQDKLKLPSSIFVADKNVPPPSWQSIDNICAKSRGLAVCVLPDSAAFEDTTIDVTFKDKNEEEVVSPQRFPFSLHFLAVCMLRVLNRDPNTHNGKLDSATESACMIVVKFYCLYRTLSVSSFLRKVSKFGRATNHIVRVPFFKEAFLPEMPTDLQNMLETAVSIQTRLDLKQKNGNSDLSEIETDLRNVIGKHEGFITDLQIAQEVSSASFLNQLGVAIASLGDTFVEREVVNSNPDDNGAIRIVSLDFKREEVNCILSSISKNVAEVNEYLTDRDFNRSSQTETDDDNKKHDRFITKTHCTFAHAQRMRQDQMRKVYGHVIGISCEVKVNAILFDGDIAALDVTIPSAVKQDGSSIIIPPSTNDFTHVTIWCKKGVKAFKSNQLPKLVKDGSAARYELHSPTSLTGTFSFWYDD